jgi:glycosyltransferase involved in cell wall biosynthesis
MEAGYFGLFVLSTKSEGVSSIYNNKEIYYFKGIDVNEISSEIINIFKCKEKFNEYRINLRNKISNYEWRNVKSKWIEALTEAVNHY